MSTTAVRTLGRVAAGTPVLALLTVVAFHAWLGHGAATRHRPDPLTGSATSAGSGWALLGLVATLAVAAGVLVWWWLPGWLPVLVVPPVFLVTASASMSTEDALWSIAVAILTATVVVVVGVASLLTAAVRDSRRPPATSTAG